MKRLVSLELKKADESRLKAMAEFQYETKELFAFKFELDNKIRQEFHILLDMLRDKSNEENIIGKYKVESLIESKLNKYHLLFDVEPNGKSILSKLLVEKKNNATNYENVNLFKGELDLKHDEASMFDFDYDVKLETQSKRGKLSVTGKMVASLFKSEVDLSAEYKGNQFSTVNPVRLTFGHSYDGSENAQSFVESRLEAKDFGIEHGGKFIFVVDVQRLLIEYLELQISRPSAAKPFSVFYKKTVSKDASSQVSFGLLNAEYDLSKRNSSLGQTLIRVDGQEILRSLVVSYAKENGQNKAAYSLGFSKNEVGFVKLELSYFGNLAQLKAASAELPKEVLGFEVFAKVLDNSGRIKAQLELESSAKKREHNFEFDLKTENIFRVLLRVISVSAKFKLDKANGVEARAEVTKIGDVKSYKVMSTSSVRASKASEWKEFDVSYEKKLATGKTISGSGVAKYKLTDFKNFQANVEVKKSFVSSLVVENARKDKAAMFGSHNLHLNMKHLDTAEKNEHEYKVAVQNKTEAFKFLVMAKEGELNSLENRDKLSFLVRAAYDRFFSKEDSVKSFHRVLGLDLKSKRFNVDLDNKLSFSKDTKANMNVNIEQDAKFPAILSEPGKMNMLKTSVKLSKLSDKQTLSFNYESDNFYLAKLMRRVSVEGASEEKRAKVREGFVNAAFKLGKDELGAEMRSFQMKFEKDERFELGALKVNLKQNQVRQIESWLKKGEVILVDDCTLSTKLEKKESSEQLEIDSLLSAQCNGKVLSSHTFSLKRKNDNSVTNKLHLSTSSDIYYSPKSLNVSHEKFTGKQGSLELSYKNGEKRITSKVSYSRELDSKTNSKLEKGKYRASLAFGEQARKECEMNIESRQDYYNSLSCKLVSQELKGLELKYGYNLRVENHKEFLSSDRRGLQLDLIIPARTVKLAYRSNRQAISADSSADFLSEHEAFEKDERDFNSTLSLHWNFVKEPSKCLTLNVKRDNYAPGKTITQIELLNSPNFRVLRAELDKNRLANETKYRTSVEYELSGGEKKNRFDFNAKFRSDLRSNSIYLETNLQRPALNSAYETKFSKDTGRLELLGLRLGHLVKLRVDKEFDPEHRRISMSLHNPDEAKYSLQVEEKLQGEVFVVESRLGLKQGAAQLSRMLSSFDAVNNKFNVKIDAIKTGHSYELDFGVFNESLANVVIKSSRSAAPLCLASLALQTQPDGKRNLVLTAKWNRLWNSIKHDLLGVEVDANAISENNGFNSHFGDVFSVLVADIKPIVEYNRKERQAIRDDLKNFALIQLQFYANLIPEAFKDKTNALKAKMAKFVMPSLEDEKTSDNILSAQRNLLEKYNGIAAKLSALSQRVSQHSEMLASLLPTLPLIEYNKEKSGEFANHLVVSRPIARATNLYQLNAEYRDRVKSMGEHFMQAKRNLARNFNGFGFKAIFNKYKLRSLDDYTLVATVYNRRNLIGFDGEHKILQARCRYLLAHETHKNRFSVVLNFDQNAYPLSVFAYGGDKSFDVSYENAAIDAKPVSLPHMVKFGDKGELAVRRTNDGVCVEVNKDLKVCCYQDSFSCTIAVTRWFTGKIDGLLGKADNNPDVISDANWLLAKSCKPSSAVLKSPSDSALKTCHNLFGKHRKSFFRDAFQAIRSSGWQRVCESVLSFNADFKCLLMKAFIHHSDLESIHMDAAQDCYSCNVNKKTFPVGHSFSSGDASVANLFEKGSDFVFLIFPCDKNKHKLDLNALTKSKFFNSGQNKYYAIKIEENDASIYQAENNEISNFDLKKAYETLSSESTLNSVSDKAFDKAIFLASSLFSKRLAQNRHLIIKSCGNCLPYSVLSTLKFSRRLSNRNIVVHSFGDYSMLNNGDEENEDEEAPIVGYDEKNVFTYQTKEKKIESEDIELNKVKHSADLCHRLAAKTHGSVLSLSQLKKPAVLSQVSESLFKSSAADFSYQLDSCQKVDYKQGDITDFSFRKVKIEE